VEEGIEKKLKVVSLLGKGGPDKALTEILETILAKNKRENTGLLWFDYNHEYKAHGLAAVSKLVDHLRSDFEAFGYFKMEKLKDKCTFEIIMEQEGTFRTNCLHCLDRTNFIQSVIARTYLHLFLNESTKT
jgi:hypothetical protein